MSENEIKPVAWMVDEQGMTGDLGTRLYWARNGGTPPSFGQNHSPLYDQSAIDRLTAALTAAREEVAEADGIIAVWRRRTEQTETERDAAVADAARWQELCRQIDAGTFPSIVIDDAMAMGAGALELQVDAARAQERKE